MTVGTRPELYWISGSPPAWRVMLGLTIKGIVFDSRRLDHGAGENKQAAYLELNPKGQVPTVVAGDVVVRESIAILAWLDRAYPRRPIWGENPDMAAEIWQDVMLMEGDLRPSVTAIAQALLRGTPCPQSAINGVLRGMDEADASLALRDFLGGDAAMASDIWLYPSIHWIARGVEKNGSAPPEIKNLILDRPHLRGWLERMAGLPGVNETYPPHWRS